MIKANELRINNWVKTQQGFGKVGTISEGKDGDFEGVVSNDNDSVWARIPYDGDIEGISLTPEILEVCGFICTNTVLLSFKKYINQVDNECIYVTLFQVGNNPEWVTEYAYKNEYSPHKKRIKYLHQLQNLYFALTGEELVIKELQTA